MNVGTNVQLIPSKDARKRTKNVHPYIQFHFIEEKTKNIQVYNSGAKNSSQCYRSKDKISRALKRFVSKLPRFLLRRRLCRQYWYYVSQLYISSISRYFYNHALRSQKGVILRWNKHAGQQAGLVSQPDSVLRGHCLQTNEKPWDKMRIHLGCSTTHGRANLVTHWIPQFHRIFTSSAFSKTKTDKKFSFGFVWTWRRAKAKLVNNKS